MSQPLPSYDGKTTLTIKEAYQYEQNMGRIGSLSFKGFCTRADNGVYPFYIVPGTRDRLINIEDIEEMYARLRANAKRLCFKDLKK